MRVGRIQSGPMATAERVTAESSVTVGRAAKVGRPRANPKPSDLAPAEEILDASARLFSTLGYTTTTTREIADAVGLRQGSLFHYFTRKEDILAELLDRTVEPATAFLGRLAVSREAAAVKLFTLARRDVDNLCSGPYNLAKLQLLPEARNERFEAFWAKRARLRNGYRDLVAAAMADGDLRADDEELGTDMLFGLVESVITWYERDGARPPATVADAVAGAGLRALGVNPRRLTAIAARADKLFASLV